LSSSGATEAFARANAILAAATAGAAERFRTGMSLEAWGARGFFSDVLDALTSALHDRVRERAEAGDADGARRAALAIQAVEDAKLRASGNVSPQLIGSSLLRDFAELRP
jgi:DNA polymerase-3 subunit delta'